MLLLLLQKAYRAATYAPGLCPLLNCLLHCDRDWTTDEVFAGSDDEEDDNDSSSEGDSDAEEAVERIKSNAFDELQKLKSSVEEEGEEASSA